VKTALWWIRRDVRLSDNQALAAALAHAGRVIPVFVLDPTLLDSPYVGPKRVAFLLGGLRQLDEDLRTRGSRLIVRRGDPRGELAALLADLGADAIFAEEDFSPYAHQRDAGVAGSLPLHLVGGPVVHPPGAVLKADGTPYTVFTPFSRRWKALPAPQGGALLPAPERIPTPPAVGGLAIPTEPALPAAVPFPPGEREAQRRLRVFVEGEAPPLYRYAALRDHLDIDGTSRLSPYLRFGVCSARQAVVAALEAIAKAPDAKARTGAETWLNELMWREFYVHILHHFPYVLQQSFRANLRDEESRAPNWLRSSGGEMMRMTDITALARPLDPHYPTNSAIALLTIVVIVGGTILQLMVGLGLTRSISWGITAGLAVFLAWALARELDPDHDLSAFVAAGLMLIGLLFFSSPSIIALFWVLVIVRMVNRTVGLPARILDSLMILGLGGWLTLQGNWICGLMTALAFLLDSQLPSPHGRQSLFVGAAIVVTAVVLFRFGGRLSREGALSLPALLAVLGAFVLFVPLIMASRELNTLGDVTNEPLHPVRVQAAQLLALLTGILMGWWKGNAGLVSVMPLWAAVLGVGLYRLWGVIHGSYAKTRIGG
jgi:hypothetical protein